MSPELRKLVIVVALGLVLGVAAVGALMGNRDAISDLRPSPTASE